MTMALYKFTYFTYLLDVSLTNHFTDNQFADKTFCWQDVSLTRLFAGLVLCVMKCHI